MLDKHDTFEYLGVMKPTDTFLDTFSVYAFARNLGTTCLEQMVLSYLLTADDVLKKDNGVHALPVQALAALNGCRNRAVYTALAKLEANGRLHVEQAATNASPPMVRLTIEVPDPPGLFMSIPLVPPVLNKPKEPKTNRRLASYKNKLGEYNRSVLVSRLTGSAMLAYHAVRTVCHTIPASKAAAKGRKNTRYGRLIGTAGLMGWIPGTEKTLGAVLGSLVDAKLLWRTEEPASSNKLRTVYSYTIAPATDFQGMAQTPAGGGAKGQTPHASRTTKSGKPAVVRSREECTKPRPMESLEDLRRELQNNTYFLEYKVNAGIKRLELLEMFNQDIMCFVEPEEEESFKAQVEENLGLLDGEEHYVKNAYQPQHTTEELRELAEKFQAGKKELKSLDTLATTEGMLERNQKELKEREGKLPGWLQSILDTTNALIRQYVKAKSPTPQQMKDTIMTPNFNAYPFSLLWIAEQQGILDNKMLELRGKAARESLANEPLAAVYLKLNSRFGRILDILEGREKLPEDEPEEPEEQVPTFELLDEWLQPCLQMNERILKAKAGCSDWSQPAVREIVLTGKIPCYAIPLLYSCNEAGCLDREILSAWRQRALGELSRMSDNLLQEVRNAPALQGILEAIMEDNAPPVTEVTENSGKEE